MKNNYQPYFDLAELIAKYLRNELTDKEKKDLEQWLGMDARNRELFTKLTDEAVISQQLEIFSASEKDRAWQRIAADTGFKKAEANQARKRSLYQYAAAVFILLAAGATVNHYFFKKEDKKPLAHHQTDLMPGGNKATLTLADGSKIVLDDAKHGKIATQQNVDIDKTQNGQVVYQVENKAEQASQPVAINAVAMNTVTTPRGGQYEVVLPDGTRAWLNAASSLTFPTEFTGNVRRVELAGEAYFEVAKNAAKPFFVKTAGQTVEVLGTHFNINSYADEKAVRTTLLEGSVKVTEDAGNSIVKLQPGQQAVKTAGGLSIIRNADIDEAMAWKNGKFLFRNTELRTIMRQLSRWYDVDVEYRGVVTERHYLGRISRNVPVSQVFQILRTSGLNFIIDGRKIIVKS